MQDEENKSNELEKMKNLKNQVQKEIENITEQGIPIHDVDILGKLVDIHKDIANEEYWEKKESELEMRYSDYEDYGRRGVPGTGRRYRGEDRIDEIREHYLDYNDAYEDMNRGNYGAENDMLRSIDGIMENLCEIVDELADEGNPEVMRIIKKHVKKIDEMI